MALYVGARLGPYEIQAAIGAGGMGEVYRARDTRLHRDVAIKVLPEAFAADPDRLARFEREAQVLASLNHANIAAIHGLEESGGARALVLEFVDGPTLADRIAHGPIPLDEALPIARQIAEALEAAHEHGIIHRDLKPANIKLRPDGTVKVLDFGLAKAIEAVGAGVSRPDATASPTITSPAMMTGAGVILGTAAYMAPEQAKGRAADKRCDVWAFGCVLYEMLTGKRAFQGDDVTDVMVAVLSKDPDWSALSAGTPAAMRRLLRRCLEKDRRERLPDIGSARLEIKETMAPPVAETMPSPARASRGRERFAWMVAAVLLFIAVALATILYLGRSPAAGDVVRALILPPDNWLVGGGRGAVTGISVTVPAEGRLAISPDGRHLAFVAADATGRRLLWIRRLDGLVAQPFEGTEGATNPFWSPDSRSLAFFAGGRLKRIDIAGGPSVTICDTPGTSVGGTWNREGVILFGTINPGSSGPDTPIQRVSASGGMASPATSVDAAAGEIQHTSPVFLPDGRNFLYLVVGRQGDGPLQRQGVYVGSLDSAEKRLLVSGGSDVAYADGHLLYLREQTLIAQLFDVAARELTGEPVPVAEQVETGATGGAFSVSQTGVLVYQSVFAGGRSQLVWFDRSGRQTATLGQPATYEFVELSPDEKQVSVSIVDPARTTHDIWIFDVARGVRTRFTSDPSDELTSAWSADSARIVFSSVRKGIQDLYVGPSIGTGGGQGVVEGGVSKYSYSWSSDGRFLLYGTQVDLPPTGGDVWVKPMFGDGKPFEFLRTRFNEALARFSPDGRWVLYQSDESGRNEVYVAPFPASPGRSLVSANGGTNGRWRRDGREIFYVADDGTLMAAEVNVEGSRFEIGSVRPLFQTQSAGARVSYDVSTDGQRFLVITTAEQFTLSPIRLVVNWPALLN